MYRDRDGLIGYRGLISGYKGLSGYSGLISKYRGLGIDKSTGLSAPVQIIISQSQYMRQYQTTISNISPISQISRFVKPPTRRRYIGNIPDTKHPIYKHYIGDMPDMRYKGLI